MKWRTSPASLTRLTRTRRSARRKLSLRLHHARRPQHTYGIGRRALAQSEDRIGRRRRRRRRISLNALTQTARAQLDLRLDAAAIAHAPIQAHTHRMVAIAAVIARDMKAA